MTMAQHDRPRDWEHVSSVDRHVCRIPRHNPVVYDIRVGDVIKCKVCKKQYECINFDYGDQRDPINPPAIRYKEL